jgi:hypothetical protein
MFDWPAKAGVDQSLTIWEEHMMGIIGGGHLMMLLLELWSIFQDHGHVRALMTTGEMVWWGLGGYDAYRLGLPCAFANTLSVLALVGLIIHSREPGLFTKDKTNEKTK